MRGERVKLYNGKTGVKSKGVLGLFSPQFSFLVNFCSRALLPDRLISISLCFHSLGQHLCKFIGTKENVCIRKEFNSHRIGSGHQYGRRDVM